MIGGTNELVWDNNALNIRKDNQKKNDLIAKFMGYQIHPDFPQCYTDEDCVTIVFLTYRDFAYQNDVLEKIKNITEIWPKNRTNYSWIHPKITITSFTTWTCKIHACLASWHDGKTNYPQHNQVPYSIECKYPKLEDAVFNAIYHFVDWYYRITEEDEN